MKKNAGIKSREEMRARLQAGEVFWIYGEKCFYDESSLWRGESPFIVENRRGVSGGVCQYWNYFEYAEIEARWEDNIGGGVWCWVGFGNIDSEIYPRIVTNYKNGEYISDGSSHWKYATPMTEEEVMKYVLKVEK